MEKIELDNGEVVEIGDEFLISGELVQTEASRGDVLTVTQIGN